jgi:hypothetical protein
LIFLRVCNAVVAPVLVRMLAIIAYFLCKSGAFAPGGNSRALIRREAGKGGRIERYGRGLCTPAVGADPASRARLLALASRTGYGRFGQFGLYRLEPNNR